MGLLKDIQCSNDIKKLTLRQKEQLCGELRESILSTVLQQGGHLASNLGVIELTVALHSVLDTSVDRLVWDVGHQSYAHKLITGRQEGFASLRHQGGLSGFPKVEECQDDAFNTGHSSTAVSAALGLARARDLLRQSHRVVAVVGDGALTGGMSYEALNDAGQSGCPMVVILNDNAMSISKNVGGMTTYLSKLRTSPGYLTFKRTLKRGLYHVPLLGRPLVRASRYVRDKVKFFILPRVFFEELGFTYVGPLDGHDLPALMDVIGDALRMNEPVFLHLMTQKGKGYAPALNDPKAFHACAPQVQEVSTGTNSGLVGQTVCAMAQQDPSLCAITAAMAAGTGLEPFAKQFPTRFFDVSIAEQHAITMAAGMARGGLHPYVTMYSTFMQRAYDSLLHDVCVQNLPIRLLIDRAGLVGADGETHQGVFDLPMLLPMPNMMVLAPANSTQLVAAIRESAAIDGPVAIRYPREALTVGELGESIWRWQALFSPARITLLAAGNACERALAAAQRLSECGITVGVVSAMCLKPMDEAMLDELASACETLIVLEDGAEIGGFASLIAQRLAATGSVRVIPFGVPDRFIGHGTPQQLWAAMGRDEHALCALVRFLEGMTDGE